MNSVRCAPAHGSPYHTVYSSMQYMLTWADELLNCTYCMTAYTAYLWLFVVVTSVTDCILLYYCTLCYCILCYWVTEMPWWPQSQCRTPWSQLSHVAASQCSVYSVVQYSVVCSSMQLGSSSSAHQQTAATTRLLLSRAAGSWWADELRPTMQYMQSCSVVLSACSEAHQLMSVYTAVSWCADELLHATEYCTTLYYCNWSAELMSMLYCCMTVYCTTAMSWWAVHDCIYCIVLQYTVYCTAACYCIHWSAACYCH